MNRQHRGSINVWAGIDVRLIGPFFLQEFLKTEKFVRSLRNNFSNLVKDIPFRDKGLNVASVR